jgi:hypothetical protein
MFAGDYRQADVRQAEKFGRSGRVHLENSCLFSRAVSKWLLFARHMFGW